MAHIAIAAAFVSHYTQIGKVAIKKFGIHFQWRNECFMLVRMFRAFGTSAKSVLPALARVFFRLLFLIVNGGTRSFLCLLPIAQ